MKKLVVLMIAIFMFSSVSYAGQWQKDEKGYKYQNDDGSYQTEWYQDVDGQWYYFDNETGYMLTNTITPDGYTISDSGVWIEEGANIKKDEQFENIVEMVATSGDLPPGPYSLGYSLPVNVYYNNEYANPFGGKIKINKVEISKDGVPYIAIKCTGNYDWFDLSGTIRYYYADGSYNDSNLRISGTYETEDQVIPYPLITTPKKNANKENPVSVDVFVCEKSK